MTNPSRTGHAPDAPAAVPVDPPIDVVRLDDMPRLAEVWEASVRATHDFLDEADIDQFRPIVRDELFGTSTCAASGTSRARSSHSWACRTRAWRRCSCTRTTGEPGSAVD